MLFISNAEKQNQLEYNDVVMSQENVVVDSNLY